MTNLYINDISVSKKILDELNIEGLIGQYDFHEMTGKDAVVEMKIDGIPDNEVAITYIMNRGRVFNPMFNMEVMIQIMIKYPAYVHVLPDKIGTEFVDIYAKYATADSVLAHRDIINENISQPLIQYSDGVAKIMAPEKWYPIVAHFGQMFCLEICKYVDVPAGSYIKGDELVLSKHPFGFREGMTVIAYECDFKIALMHNNFENLYINYHDINFDIDEDILKHTDWPEPEVFATWVIGPKCRELRRLFRNCPYEPHIYGWDVSRIRNITELFMGAKVRDLSMMKFDDCVSALNAFSASSIEKSPQFPEIIAADKMFEYSNIMNIDGLSTNNIASMNKTFQNCHLLKSGFNNCKFPKLEACYKCFNNCFSLETCFNNCDFPGLIYMESCMKFCHSLQNALNNCNMPKCTDFKGVFKNAMNLESAANNCIFGSSKTDWCHAFLNCLKLKRVFSDAALTIQKDLIFTNCLELETIDKCDIKIMNNTCCEIFIKCPKLRINQNTKDISIVYSKNTLIGCLVNHRGY